MEYIVLDLEWNQGNSRREELKPDLPFEIIEIGAIKLDEKRNVIGSFHRIIRPVVYPRLFEMTRKLLDVSEKDLEQGVGFVEAAREFFNWCGKEYRFCTWGLSDLGVLQQNLDYFHVSYQLEYPLYYYDVQQLYSIAFDGMKGLRSLEYAVRALVLPIERPFHGALYDAEYTAEVFCQINPGLVSRYPALDIYRYPGKDEKEIIVQYPESRMIVSPTRDTKVDVKQEKQMYHLCCAICDRRLKKIMPWFTGNMCGRARTYYTLGHCKLHGYMKGKLFIKKPEPTKYFGIQMVQQVSEEAAGELKQRYQDKLEKKLQKQKKV